MTFAFTKPKEITIGITFGMANVIISSNTNRLGIQRNTRDLGLKILIFKKR